METDGAVFGLTAGPPKCMALQWPKQSGLLFVRLSFADFCLSLWRGQAPCANVAEVPGSLKKELGGVCKACFSAEQVSKHGWEMQQHREVRQRCDAIYTCNSLNDNR
eukprot:scaffold109894_cov17-Prasinocladus_malaysianus.AAC.2